jgi:hypothetical protein
MYTLDIHYLDVGQGDCSLIIVREDGIPKRTVVYDCGSDNGATAGTALITKINNINDSRPENEAITQIHIAFISHFDKDHFNGFTLLLEKALEDDNIKSLFYETLLYTQGCIFKRFPAASFSKDFEKVHGCNYFYSAYNFENGAGNPQTILEAPWEMTGGTSCTNIRTSSRRIPTGPLPASSPVGID